MDHEIFKPFGPSIVKIKIPQNIIQEMNNFVDEIIHDKEKLVKLNALTIAKEFLIPAKLPGPLFK